MIQVKKTRKSKSLLAIIITSALLVILGVGIAVVAVFMGKETETPPVAGTSSTTPIYDSLDNVAGFDIESHNGYFGGRYVYGTYYYYYEDEDGKRQPYYPDICEAEPNFNYSSLYAITDDGMRANKIAYILHAMMNPMYDSRIELASLDNVSREEQLANYESQLSAYGLDKEGRETIEISYYVDSTDEDGKPTKVIKKRTVYIGNKLVTGTGYYVRLESNDYPEGDEYNEKRDEADKYVYVSSSAENYAYALEGFKSFVKPSIVMGGNSANGDTAEIPQLTTSYRQWSNVVFDKQGDVVKERTKVIFTGNVLSSAFSTSAGVNDEDVVVGENGYVSRLDTTEILNLDSIASNKLYANLIKALVGKSVNDYSKNNIISTVIFDKMNVAEIGKTYSYKIYEIEAAVDDKGNEYRTGAVGQNAYVKVRYSCTFDGKEEIYEGAEADKLHAVISLDDERIPESVRENLRSLSIGVLSSPLSFDITYTANNSTPSTYEYVIKHISSIIDVKTNTEVDVISDKTAVIFTYEIKYNGEVVEESYTTINLSENPEEENELYKGVKAALLGAKKDDKGMYPTNISAYKSYTYFQSFMDFTTYEIKSIDYFVEQKEIAAFKYISTDNVDNYLGGIIHINNLPEGSEYSSYDLDMESCDRVIKILSGTLPGGSSTSFDGLAGSKVVAVGLTPDVMKEFGLYEYTIYYELPRYYDLDEDTYKATVGFTLYISKNKDGIRYVGSDMFDIVVEIEQSKFDFVEKSFVEFWASRDIAMIDQTLVENLTVNFNLESFKGKYSFMVDHPEVWMVTYADPSSPTGQKTFRVYEEPANDTPGLISKQRYDAASIVNVAVSGDNVTETLLVKLLKESGHEYINIHETYYYRGYEQQSIGFDYLGEAYFRDVLYAIYSTGYSGILAEGEADRAREREAVMSLSFGVTGSNRNIVYNFYYTEYGRVAVEINDGANKPCHFYVTNHAFKGIVNAIYDLVNGNIVEINAGYKN